MRHFQAWNVASFALGAGLTFALLTGCGSSGTGSSTNGNPTNSGASSMAGCGSNIGAGANSAGPSSTDVITYHYDNLRTGENTGETILTTANVNSAQFGKLGEFTVPGKVDAQPLYLSNVSIPGVGTRMFFTLRPSMDAFLLSTRKVSAEARAKPSGSRPRQWPAKRPAITAAAGR